MIHVLALLARAGHGKTTVANDLRDTHGATIVSLATPLKKIAQATMGFSDAQLWGTQEEKESLHPPVRSTVDPSAIIPGAIRDVYGDSMSARIFLQKLGTEGIRKHLGPETWLNALVYNIEEDYTAKRSARAAAREQLGAIAANDNGDEDAVYIVDDVRFINEVKFIQRLTKLSAPDRPKFFGSVIKLVCTDAPKSGNDDHPSEREVDMIPPELIDATATSSRALGTEHLLGQVEEALALPQLANLRGALKRSGMAAAAARASDEREKRRRDEAINSVVTRMRERTSGG